jgi:hypothetical protein
MINAIGTVAANVDENKFLFSISSIQARCANHTA